MSHPIKPVCPKVCVSPRSAEQLKQSARATLPAVRNRLLVVGWFLFLLGNRPNIAIGEQLPAMAKPDLVIRRTVRYTDYHRILSIPFEVPPGTIRISMRFAYTQQSQHTALDMGLMGPTGLRGWSGGDKEGFTLALSDATPSYLPGPIQPGHWTLLLGVPNIRPGVVSQFSSEVYFDRSSQDETADPLVRQSLRSGPAWYRGDLHMHTAHSDGFCKSQAGRDVSCPLFRSVEAATARGLDFIAVTDHNTQSHYDGERELQPYFDKILLMPAREITTYQGHANLFGTTAFLDFRLGTPEVPDLNTMLRYAQSLGATISINHPSVDGGENCMGCAWQADEKTDYRLIQAVEVVNGSEADGRKSGVAFWEALLNRGFHLTGIGGSDNHDASHPIPGPGSIGYPTTVIQARDLSTPSLLEGLRAGHVFVDTEGTNNRMLEYSAIADTQIAAMGEDLKLAAGTPLQLSVHTMNVQGAHLEVISDGRKLSLAQSLVIRDADQRTTVVLPASDTYKWIRLDVCASNGHRLLIGNPIYLSYLGSP
jgi:hypothetical protein